MRRVPSPTVTLLASSMRGAGSRFMTLAPLRLLDSLPPLLPAGNAAAALSLSRSTRRVTSRGRGCRKAGSRDAWLPALDALWAGATCEAVCRLLRGCGRTAAEVLLLRCEFNGRCRGRADGAP